MLKIKIGPVKKGDVLIEQEAVMPVLSQVNAGGRLVYVPPEQWPGVNKSGCGWVAKILSVHKGTDVVTLKFHDSKQCFAFPDVLAFKPLS